LTKLLPPGEFMASEIVLRTALLIGLVMTPGGTAIAQDDEVARGHTLVSKMCGECHAVGRTGASPHAGAPTFRSIDDHTDLDEFMDRLRAGLQSSHPDMPSFRFSRDDARAVVAYLRSLQGP
jgi:mono/diheme cytochrome c family protein